MKTSIALSILAASALLCGCNPDKSADTQVMAPTGGVSKDSEGSTAKSNPNIPDAAKQAIPGAR